MIKGNYISLIIPFEALDEPNEELIKRLRSPGYLITYFYLRRFVCRDENNPIAGMYYSEGKLVSYVPREKIASVVGVSLPRISQILTQMEEWGDIVQVSWDGRNKVWELGRLEDIETPHGVGEIEIYYFDVHIGAVKNAKKRV